jgi:predicted metal-dependent enzyme (double-stranded beta helix superfamily)
MTRRNGRNRAVGVGAGLGLMLAAVAVPAVAAAPVIDNERVTVWDVTLANGDSAPPTSRDLDTVIMFLEGGTIRTVVKGKTTTATHAFGDAVFVPAGSDAVDTLISAGHAHEVVIALKPHAVPSAVPNTSGFPLAFPRPGVVKVLENARVVVWHYAWTPGVATPMHFHDKEVVVAYRQNGALTSITPDGERVVNAYKSGEIRFNAANRIHQELLVGPPQSAVMMELK